MYVEMKNIVKKYGDFLASDHVSLGVEKGKLVALLGPSGSGKTTLLRMIAGLENPNEGDIYIDGKRVNDVPAAKRGIGFVFQNFQLMPRESALDNVCLPLIYAGVKKRERKEMALAALERVGLAERAAFKPTQLSGGQKQRVAIARAMVNNPKILLADEPTGALDSKSGHAIMELFGQLNEEGVTVVMITHDIHVAEQAKRIMHIIDGELSENQAAAKEKADVSGQVDGKEEYA